MWTGPKSSARHDRFPELAKASENFYQISTAFLSDNNGKRKF